MANIGIVGAGVSSLHLGIRLCDANIPATIYAPQTAEEFAQSRMLNSVAHMDDTIRREREMGIEFWNETNSRICHYRSYNVLLPDGRLEQSRGSLHGDERCVDYRLYLPRLMQEFVRRGGQFNYSKPTATNFDELYEHHDLLAIACGKKHDGFGDFFPQIDELSKFQEPQRRICAGLYTGVRAPEPLSVTFNVSVGHGELIELPMETADGPRTALLIEARPEGAMADLMDLDYDADPIAFHDRIVNTLRTHFPAVFERVDFERFGLIGAKHLLQGAIRPVTRHSWAEISDGCFAVAIGDLRCTLDPLTGQGANLASYGACALADHIAESDQQFDQSFFESYDDRVRYRVAGVVNFTRAMLDPNEHTRKLIHALPENQAVCDDFSSRFARPETLWFDVLKDSETCEQHIAKFGAAHKVA
ncbi:MAG: hypothetical protein ACI9BW_003539 [Gammaproteobacteria bacterium]|jgi:hypothetical protein